MAESGEGWIASFCGSGSEGASPDRPSRSESVKWAGIGAEEAAIDGGVEGIDEGKVELFSTGAPQTAQKFPPSLNGLPHLVQNIFMTSRRFKSFDKLQ
jgi:hypothetical protein